MAVVSQGPTGEVGVIAGWTTGNAKKDTPLAYQDSQVWKPLPANPEIGREAGDVWIGWNPNKPPTPLSLIRKKPHPGSLVTLRDGHRWLVAEVFKLPRVFGQNPETGEWMGIVEPEFRDFCERAEAVAMQFADLIGQLEALKELHPELDPKDITLDTTVEEGVDLAVEALALNYRVTREIVGALELFDKAAVVRTLCSMVSWYEVLEVQDGKKKIDLIAVPSASQRSDGYWQTDED